MSSCPKDIKKQTNNNEIRVTWDYPEFEDNFDKPPVQLLITSNRNPGANFPWGRYQVLYEASDRAGNKANCEFYVEVGRKLKAFLSCVSVCAPSFHFTVPITRLLLLNLLCRGDETVRYRIPP